MADLIRSSLEATSISQIRRELDGHWAAFAEKQEITPAVRPEIVESWQLCRDEYHIDRAMRRSQLTLTADDLEQRRLEDEILQASLPYLAELKEVLRDTDHVLTYFNADCSMLECEGDEKVRARLAEINFAPGGNWSERVAGTNGPGTALARKAAVQVLASEHYVEAWQTWACYAVPILDPVTGEPVAVLDATGYREAVRPGMLALLRTVARAIQQDLHGIQLRKDISILDKYADAATARGASAMLAVDNRGRILKYHPASMKVLHLAKPPKWLVDIPEMRSLLAMLRAEVESGKHNGIARNIELAQPDKHFSASAIPVMVDQRLAGAVLLLDDHATTKAAGRRSQSPGKSSTRYSFESISGHSAGLQRAFGRARQAALHDMPVLITGESGTGKEMFAQAIHKASGRADGPFIAVNCGSIPRELLESELFGYVSGAFTGARSGGSAGKFELACSGTIFLDEASELSLAGQVALLRVLQEMEVVRVGSSAPISIDVRVIAASNKNLLDQVNQGLFRRDLYYRLNVFSVDLPALRDREDDVLLLAYIFLTELGQNVGRTGLSFSPEVLAAFRGYSWPGNVRELRNLVQRIVVMCSNTQIDLADLAEIEPVIAAHGSTAIAPQEKGPGSDGQETDPILKMVEDCGGNVSEAARRLGLSRMTIYRKLHHTAQQRR